MTVPPAGARRQFRLRFAGALLCVAWLSGCAGLSDGGRPPGTAAHATHANPADTGENEFSAELLYQLLLANIAGQRGHNEVALESLSRAAHLSRDRRIVAQAIGLAARLEDHRRVIELSGLMAEVSPDESRHHLMLANARLQIGQSEQALKALIDLARVQRTGTGFEAVLQSIASLLAGRPPAERMQERFQRGIEAWPHSPELKLIAALLADELEQDTAFRALLDETLELRPGWAFPAMLKLTGLTDLDPRRMTAYAEEFLRQFPNIRPFRVHYAKLLLHLVRVSEGLAQLEIVLEQDPQSAEAWFTSGAVYLEREDLPQALERLSRALVLEPDNDQIRLYLADVKIAQEEYDDAVAMLGEIAAPAYYLDVETRLAVVIARREGVEAGIRYLAEIDARGEDEEARVILEQDLLYRDFGLLERARAVLDAGLEKMPAHPDLLYNRGLLATQLDLPELYERDLRTLIRLQPDNADAYNALGYTLADRNERLDEALELITRALKITPNAAHILDSMGWVHFRIGNNDTAIEYLRRALERQKNAEIAAHLGEALWVAGKRREARKIWEQGKKWAPDNAVLLDTMKRFLSGDSSVAPALGEMLAARRTGFAPGPPRAP